MDGHKKSRRNGVVSIRRSRKQGDYTDSYRDWGRCASGFSDPHIEGYLDEYLVKVASPGPAMRYLRAAIVSYNFFRTTRLPFFRYAAWASIQACLSISQPTEQIKQIN
jgi:hypothetical protein